MRIFCPATLILFLASPRSHSRRIRGVQRWVLLVVLYNVVRLRGRQRHNASCLDFHDASSRCIGKQTPNAVLKSAPSSTEAASSCARRRGRFSRITRSRTEIFVYCRCLFAMPLLGSYISGCLRSMADLARSADPPSAHWRTRRRHVRFTSNDPPYQRARQVAVLKQPLH